MNQIAIPIDKEAVAEFCKRNQIRRLALFGSVVRDDFKPDSDVDILVEFAPEARVGFFRLFDIEEEFSTLVGGRKIDTVTFRSLNHRIRDQVLAEAQMLYDEG